MEKLEIILSLAGTAITFLAAAVTFVIKFIRSVKAKRIAEGVGKILGAVMPYIRQAETFVHYSGAEKKEFVMTKANRYAIENGINFNAELIGEKIEELVKLTKEVNKRDKDNQQPEPDKTTILISR